MMARLMRSWTVACVLLATLGAAGLQGCKNSEFEESVKAVAAKKRAEAAAFEEQAREEGEKARKAERELEAIRGTGGPLDPGADAKAKVAEAAVEWAKKGMDMEPNVGRREGDAAHIPSQEAAVSGTPGPADPRGSRVEAIENELKDQVIADLLKEYEMAKRLDDKIEACVKAGIIRSAYLQRGDELNYKKWGGIRDTDCGGGYSPLR